MQRLSPSPSLRRFAVDQVDGRVVLEQLDVGRRGPAVFERVLHRAAGGVGGVHDAPVAMAALAGQVVALGVGDTARRG
jgi:hypothetical protein